MAAQGAGRAVPVRRRPARVTEGVVDQRPTGHSRRPARQAQGRGHRPRRGRGPVHPRHDGARTAERAARAVRKAVLLDRSRRPTLAVKRPQPHGGTLQSGNPSLSDLVAREIREGWADVLLPEVRRLALNGNAVLLDRSRPRV